MAKILIARGMVLNEAALLKALKERRIAGAALDMFTEAPPKRSELFSLSTVIATPHIASSTEEAMRGSDNPVKLALPATLK